VGDVGYGVSWDGTPTELPCQAGRWTIFLISNSDFGSPVGRATVTVTGGATVDIAIHASVVPTPGP
jgi:hypothetical protein